MRWWVDRRVWGVLSLAGVALFAFVGRPGSRRVVGPPWKQPNVLLITVDTLRADAVGANDATPFLAENAKQSVAFSRAYATSSWTPPSIASLVTGTYPSRHGVERSLVWPDNGRIKVIAQETLPTDLRLLPEILHDAGYATFGITANEVLSAVFGYARGFDRYACLGFADDGHAVLEKLDEWLVEIQSREPWFVWLHFLEPHAPYRAREPYFSSYWPSPERFPELEEVVPARSLAEHGVRDESARLRYVRSLYRSEVAAVDSRIREVFQRLVDADDVLAIVTADHGEEFLDHGGFGHGNHLFEETIRVPLYVRFPNGWQAGREIDAPVSLVDVLPSILDSLGLAAEVAAEGDSLIRLANGDVSDRGVYAKLLRTDKASAVIQGRWKLIDVSAPVAVREIYDLVADPGETEPVEARHSPALGRLTGMLERHQLSSSAARSGENPVVPLLETQADELRALGYLE